MPTAPESSPNNSFGVDAPVPRKRTRRHRRGGKKEVPASEVSTSAPPPRIEALMSTPSTPTPTVTLFIPECSTSTGPVDSARENEDMASDVPVSRKRSRARTRRNQRRKATPKSPVTYHVRNGHLVTLASEPERSQAPSIPSASQPEEDDQDAQMPPRIRHREGQEAKTPLLSPANPSHPSPRSARLKPSPSSTKEDAWTAIVKRGGTWPELPSLFSHWDVQVCVLDASFRLV